MLKIFVTCVMVSVFSSILKAQDSIQATIVVIGDAGELTNGKHPVVDAVRKNVELGKKTTILFVGDNLYKTGLPDDALPTYDIAKAPLDSQIHIARNKPVDVYFVPGNHDWANGGPNGYESILRVQRYIDILGNNKVKMFPRNGCPGPVDVKITDDVTLVMMDSQWWLHENDKPGIESDCPYKTKAEVLTQLGEILSVNKKKLILFAFHHPLKTYGPHGGYFTWKQHLFPLTDAKKSLYIPLPIIGSAYPLTRAVFGTAQDLKHPIYQDMIKQVEGVVKQHPNVVFLSGHEHSMQLIQDSGFNYIVSGSGSKNSRVSKGRYSLYASSSTGFVTLEISKNKNVQANFYQVDGDSVKVDFTTKLLNFTEIPEEITDTIRQVEYSFKDTVSIAASDKYKNYSGFRRFFLGKNYRAEWSAPVLFKEFNIRKEQGGFNIKSLGGGKQSKSLKLLDKNGKEWSLRSVDKDPAKALPANLRGTLAQKIVQDMISAGHPYAPLVVPTLASAVGVVSAQPKYFFVPDDPALGRYQKLFAGTVVTLEDRDPTHDGSETKSTNTILNKMYEDNDHHVDQEAVLKARLLDMLIGDWDRHADQWKWGVGDTGKGKLYYPVPRDRDQAFFYSGGLLTKIIARVQIPYLKGFTRKIKDVEGFNMVAKDFDRAFLNTLDLNSWTAMADTFQRQVTDAVIIEAVRKLPPKILAMDSALIVGKLISRRNDLKRAAIAYYNFISKVVTVTGSNKKEYFRLENVDGDVKLSVYKKNKETDSVTLMFRRVFKDNETKELILFGLNNEDKFEVDSDVNSRMLLRIIGGKGSDTFDLKGNIKNKVYDLSQEGNYFAATRRTRKELSTNPSILDYTESFTYNKFVFPQINLGYNAEDQLLLGLGFNSTTHGFRKEPYKTDQKLSTLASPSLSAYQANYRGVFNELFFKNDLIVNAKFVSPTLNNFFGYGNETVLDKSKDREYYRVRYKYVEADILVRKRKFEFLELSAGPSYYHYFNDYDDNRERILDKPAIIGTDSASIYTPKHYLGGKLKMDINYINNTVFPSRGITWYTEFTSLKGLTDNSSNLTKLTSDMTIYATVSDQSRVTTVLRAGAGKIYSNNPEYFQMLTLGTNNYMRGFRKNRFSGTSLVYGSAELRVKLFKSKSYILPGDVGIIGFYDVGRVWITGERSNKWHSSYGGGLYFVPYNLVMVSAAIGFSEEDRLFNFTLGTKFNLTF